MNKLNINNTKCLKLTNVLSYKCLFQQSNININIVIEQMKSYIRSKGAMQIGPLIQYTKTNIQDSGAMDMEMYLMMQCNCLIQGVEEPYVIEPMKRITNCMYCRFIGPENQMRLAYDKINVVAFEDEISLKRECYTVFVESNEDFMTVDVFIPRAEE